MTPNVKRLLAASLLAVVLLPPAARDAHAIRVVTWNIYAYPTQQLAARQPSFRTVIDSLHADVIVAQELNSQAGSDSFLINVLNVVEPGEWTGQWRFLGAGEGGSIFWKPAVVNVDNISAVSNSGGPRDFLVGRVTPVGYASNDAKFLTYSLHLKAGSSGADIATRTAEGLALRNNYLNVIPPVASGGNFLVGGDYNMDNANEGGYVHLTESTMDNDGQCKDPLRTAFFWSSQWGNNSGFALGHSQSACLAGCISSTGGMDDRFDLWLTSFSMQDGEGLDYLPAPFADEAYPWTFGNDGTKYNQDINSGGANGSVGNTVATALWAVSDHIPVVIVIQVPPKVVAVSEFDFGDAIVGGTHELNLDVSNGAVVPGDELDYSFTPPAGFTAPGGSFQANAGAAANGHLIGISTATSGNKAGTLAIASDDPDSSTKNVLLSGTILEHAIGSLDSLVSTQLDTLDFGEHETGMFPDSFVRVHNTQQSSFQAKLSVDNGVITGGDGRFTFIGGFTGALLDDVGKTYDVEFDDSGATLDSTYTATLTFSVSDEPLPGATALPDVVVQLLATPKSATVSVGPNVPTALRFYAPRPNPLTGGTRFAFDLPQASPVTLDVYDLSGRRVATLASGTLNAGRHETFWNATDASGARIAAGVYFARFTSGGLLQTQRLVVLP